MAEHLQGEASPEQLTASLVSLIESPDGNRRLRERFLQGHRRLRRGASEMAADAVMRVAGLT